MLVPKFLDSAQEERHDVSLWLLSGFSLVLACSHPPPRVSYMSQIWLKSRISSTSHFPKEFRNMLARASKLALMSIRDKLIVSGKAL
jgi:hypothetical protein